jgi:hypothetical protein
MWVPWRSPDDLLIARSSVIRAFKQPRNIEFDGNQPFVDSDSLTCSLLLLVLVASRLLKRGNPRPAAILWLMPLSCWVIPPAEMYLVRKLARFLCGDLTRLCFFMSLGLSIVSLLRHAQKLPGNIQCPLRKVFTLTPVLRGVRLPVGRWRYHLPFSSTSMVVSEGCGISSAGRT